MGTVGLSFGSPTSGAGFDVSTTVASIVSNLENIETPWKNQLTTLQSQDTVISNLGTLFSTVSTDIGQLTDFQGVLAQKSGSSSDINVLELTSASTSAMAGTHTVVVNNLAQTSSGYLAPITNASDTLSGSITLRVGTGTAQTINVSSLSNQTLAGLAAAINSSGADIEASVLSDSSGSRLSLVSATSGGNGNITVSANSIVDTTTSNSALAYTSAVSGKDASLTVDGVDLSSSSNTVTNLIPGLTFQLLEASPQSSGSAEQVQVVIANDNSGVESAVNQLVTDYNSLIDAITAQEGDTSTGTAEPLFGSPTISLLQQQLLNSLNAQNPNGYLDAIPSTGGTTLADGNQITIAMGNGSSATFKIGSGSDSATPGTYYTDNIDAGGVDQGNTLSGLAATINAASGSPLWSYSGTAGTDADAGAGTAATTSSGSLNAIADEDDTLAGSIVIQVGNGTAQTVTLDSSDNTLAGLQEAINSAGIGVNASIVQDSTTGLYSLSLVSGTPGSAGTLTVTSNIQDMNTVGVNAGVATSNGQSTLTLTSETSRAGGALTVDSSIVADTGTALASSVTPGSDSQNSSAAFTSVAEASDSLSGTVTIQAGDGQAITVLVPGSPDNTLAGLVETINNTAGIGVTASTVTNSDGSLSLSLVSNAAGSAGDLTVTSNLFDNTDTASSTTLNYTNSSDVNSLTSLGISLNNDGSMTFDASTLDSLLNTDFNSAVGFFQNANSWGQSFSSMLTNSGNSSSTGILSLAAQSDSSIETNLNAKITSENSQISTEQTKLTTELNQANEILQELPSQLDSINELYSAITGYNQGTNG